MLEVGTTKEFFLSSSKLDPDLQTGSCQNVPALIVKLYFLGRKGTDGGRGEDPDG